MKGREERVKFEGRGPVMEIIENSFYYIKFFVSASLQWEFLMSGKNSVLIRCRLKFDN